MDLVVQLICVTRMQLLTQSEICIVGFLPLVRLHQRRFIVGLLILSICSSYQKGRIKNPWIYRNMVVGSIFRNVSTRICLRLSSNYYHQMWKKFLRQRHCSIDRSCCERRPHSSIPCRDNKSGPSQCGF